MYDIEGEDGHGRSTAAHEYKHNGNLKETKNNQKSKRLSVDETSQTLTTNINSPNPIPVRVIAQYIERNPEFTMMCESHTQQENLRFPRIEEMAHFHYDNIDFRSPLEMRIFDDSQSTKTIPGCAEEDSIKITVSCHGKRWVIARSWDDLVGLDLQFHRCVYDRHYSGLEFLKGLSSQSAITKDIKSRLKKYIDRLSEIAGNTIWCGPILNWFEVDNKGNHLMLTEDSPINVPAVAAARVIKRYTAQDSDELSFEVGDIVSVIDMPPNEESPWWRGKHKFEVGFFPSQCVQVIGESPAPETPPRLNSVASKRGKVVSYLRMFLSSRPTRAKLLQSGILRERTFGCDLGEHLQRAERNVPLVLQICVSMVEEFGITNGVYRLSGMASNVQKIRILFDTEELPNLKQDCFLHDIHCIGSALKMYFRELPNPLLTFHLYEKFTKAIQIEDGFDREIAVHHVVQQLPPPHYRTLEYLMKHLAKIADYHKETAMHAKNLAIVWAPNLLRQEKMDESMTLQNFGFQASVIEFLIRNVDIFFDKDTAARTITNFPPSPMHRRSRSDPAVSELLNEDHIRSKIRPSSVGVSPPPKLISLEEARLSRSMTTTASIAKNYTDSTIGRAVAEPPSPVDSPTEQLHPDGLFTLSRGSNLKPGKKYIDVGEGPAALPEFHTVIELPNRRKQPSRSSRKWKSLFAKRPESAIFSSKQPEELQQRSTDPSDPTGNVHRRSKSFDELSRDKSPPEKETRPRASFLNSLSRSRFGSHSTPFNQDRSTAKFYVNTDLPPTGTRGTFSNSVETTRHPSTLVERREETTPQKNTGRTAVNPGKVLPTYEQAIRNKSNIRTTTNATSELTNSDDATFFVAGVVDQKTNTRTVEVFCSPNLQMLKKVPQ